MEEQVNDNLYFILITGSLGMAVLATIVIGVVIYYQKRRIKHQHELQQVQLRHQMELLQKSIEVQEKERKRFAEDLHDEAGAILSAVKLNLYGVAQGNMAMIDQTRELLDTAITGIRRVSHDLSPPGLERFGLCQTIADLCEKMESGGHIRIQNDLEGIERNRFPLPVETAVYRILSELLANTYKHSGATLVKVFLAKANNGLVLEYTDNGSGFESTVDKAPGAGIKNMESRVFALNGKMKIESTAGKGFEASIYIPLQKTHDEN